MYLKRRAMTIGRPLRSDLQMAVIGTISALANYVVGLIFKVPTVHYVSGSLSFQIVKFFRIEPPRNSRTIEVPGTGFISRGKNHSRNASKRFASMYSGVPYGTWRRSGSAKGLSAASS